MTSITLNDKILWMRRLLTENFSKWASKQNISFKELIKVFVEVESGNFEARLGGNIYKKRIRIEGRGKRGGYRIIVCYKREDRAIFIHGFAKNEKSNLSPKEINVFRELSKILLHLTHEKLSIAVKNGAFIEV